jgi:hypothetical protein
MNAGNPNDPDRYTANESVAIREAVQRLEAAWRAAPMNFAHVGEAIRELRAAAFDYPQRTVSPRGERDQLATDKAELLAALERMATVLRGAVHPSCRRPDDALASADALIAKHKPA